MSKLKKFVSASLRWSWFGLLVMLAFGYLAAGLSKTPDQRAAAGGRGEDALPLASAGEDSSGEDSSVATAVASTP